MRKPPVAEALGDAQRTEVARLEPEQRIRLALELGRERWSCSAAAKRSPSARRCARASGDASGSGARRSAWRRCSREAARAREGTALAGGIAHGVARATADLDLQRGREVRHGDEENPLGGVVRVASPGERNVDLIVGRHTWQRGILERAAPLRIGSTSVHVVSASDLVLLNDLVLLKLYAGGPQDVWDIDQLLALDASIGDEVEARLAALPEDCAAMWRRIRGGRTREG